ncbi:MAG TPA: universal stress protein [Jatrophihabitans sp.]|jgi:nucleotide-binding universal stress UspA family protein|uniref:universal stress protein n=1 Tax=Jatrophihabitans sp. TaxID=1932789 RepID=UPI002DF86E89|nr:universal stress protein [Jatrophihabitans sp.]
MSSVVVAIVSPGTEATVTGAATALAEVLGASVRREFVDPDAAVEVSIARFVALLDEPDAVAAAVSFASSSRELMWGVLAGSRKPVVVMPDNRAKPPAAVARALVPLEATTTSAAALEETLNALAGAGVDIVVLHVLDPMRAPAYWDHPGHAAEAWVTEFLARFCRHRPDVRMTVRTGAAEESIPDVARAERVDLVVLVWSQRLDPGRARIVRRTLGSVGVPVLLVPAT